MRERSAGIEMSGADLQGAAERCDERSASAVPHFVSAALENNAVIAIMAGVRCGASGTGTDRQRRLDTLSGNVGRGQHGPLRNWETFQCSIERSRADLHLFEPIPGQRAGSNKNFFKELKLERR
jgi:hypothetical protein